MSEAEILAEAVRRIREQFVPAQIILVGSRSRGTARADSDFDLMVIREDAGNWRTPGQILAALRDLPAAFDVQVESTAEWDKWSQFEPAFEFEVAKTGRRLLHG